VEEILRINILEKWKEEQGKIKLIQKHLKVDLVLQRGKRGFCLTGLALLSQGVGIFFIGWKNRDLVDSLAQSAGVGEKSAKAG
jgi:hypothetical protein